MTVSPSKQTGTQPRTARRSALGGGLGDDLDQVGRDGEADAARGAGRRYDHAVDADQPVTQIRTLEELLHDFERAYPRFSTTLFSIFAAVGLLLAMAAAMWFVVGQPSRGSGIVH